ncbi:MAG: hypothetical protein ACKO5C_02500 [Ferruginibacter sp.]
MKQIVLAGLILSIFSIGCSNRYAITQTPDDVYFSPVQGASANQKNKAQYTQQDRTVRMSRFNRRWRFFDDDFGYDYHPYQYGYAYGYYYNPYYYPMPVFSGFSVRNPVNSTPRTSNLNSYNFQEAYVPNPKYQTASGNTRSIRIYNNSNQSGTGNTRTILTPGSADGRGYNPTRTTSPTQSGSPVTRPARN